MSKCKVCKKTLTWRQNEETERWVPFDPNGDCHLMTCKGIPPRGSKKQLEEKIDKLADALQKAEDKLANEKYWRERDKEEHYKQVAQYKHLEVYLLVPWQNVINVARALGRAKLNNTGKVNHHVARIKTAALILLEAENRRKKEE